MTAVLPFDPRLEPWMQDGVCNQTDPEAFFPERGESTKAAKKVCRRCPVRAQCLEYALEHEELFGVWGGLSAFQRRPLLEARATSAA